MSASRDDRSHGLSRQQPPLDDPSRRPPRLAVALLRRVLPGPVCDDVLGDLEEGYAHRVRADGRRHARRWFWSQALRAVPASSSSLHDPRRPPARWRARNLRERGMDRLRQDLAFAARQLRRSPGFTAAVVVTLALGIGANTAMFSWLDALLFAPVTVEDPDRLVRLYVSHPGGFDYGAWSYADFVDVRRDNQVFTDMLAARNVPLSFSGEDGTELVFGFMVSGNYFDALGVDAAVGRTFAPSDDEVPGRDPVAVISHGFWERRLGADAAVVGRQIVLNGTPFTVIGVTPPGFQVFAVDIGAEVWVPMMMQQVVMPGINRLDSRGARSLQVMGRLEEGVGLEQARANLDAVAAGLAAAYPTTNQDRGINVVPLAESIPSPEFHDATVRLAAVLTGVVGFVLLIACASVANLMLARATRRRHEVGVRLALGASRRRVVGQLLIESVLLALLAGGAGLLLAAWINRLVRSFEPPIGVPVSIAVGIDGKVLLFTLAAALLTGLLFGLVPALRATRPDLVTSLKGEAVSRGSAPSRLRGAIVVAQIALSMVLLVGTGLFLRSLLNARSVDPGFEVDDLLIATLDPGLQGYEPARSQDLFRELSERVEALPGVRAMAVAEMVPMSLGTQQWGVHVPGYQPRPNERMNLDYNVVGPGYFETLGIRPLAGRTFRPQDDAGAPGAIIVNRSMARRFWPDGNAIGRTVHTVDMERVVVGVVPDSKYYTLGEEAFAYFYVPMAQTGQTAMTLHVRTEGEPMVVAAALRRELRELDPNLPLFDVKTMADQMSLALFVPRLTAWVLGSFGSLALLLASVGLYGVMAYSVSQRTREIGVRMALGASLRDVRRMVLRHGTVLTAVGLGIGAIGGLAVGFLVTRLLYDVAPVDTLVLASGASTIAAVALLASWVPARRAMRVDPVRALRDE